jgi:hypothetical protein
VAAGVAGARVSAAATAGVTGAGVSATATAGVAGAVSATATVGFTDDESATSAAADAMAKTQKDKTSKNGFKFIAKTVKKLIFQKRQKLQCKNQGIQGRIHRPSRTTK